LTIVSDLSTINPEQGSVKMKILINAAAVMIVLSGMAVAQFRSQPEVSSSVAGTLIRPDDGGLIFGWFDPSRLTIRNSYSLSYTSSGNRGYSIGNLTSSLAYQISNPLWVQFDISLLHSPFNNLGGNFAKDITGVYLSRAELNYRPSKNMLLQIQYRQLPAMYWLNNYDRFSFMPWYERIDDEEIH
jgi:hypothetical protein